MSRFFAKIQGSEKEVTRTGSGKSGIYGDIAGWDIGIIVRGFVTECGEDEFMINLTDGSNGQGKRKYIGSFTVKDLEK